MISSRLITVRQLESKTSAQESIVTLPALPYI